MVVTTRLIKSEDINGFVFGGKARFTVRSMVTGSRNSYHVDKTGNSYLASAKLAGEYRTIGYIDTNHDDHLRIKYGVGMWNEAVQMLDYVIRYCYRYTSLHKNMAFRHRGFCAACTTPLTDHDSIASGFCPACINKKGERQHD